MRGEPGETDRAEPLLAASGEVRSGCTQHQTVHVLGVSSPDQLSDRAAHRVADRDEAVDAQRRRDVDCVVGAVLEPERLLRAQPRAVSAMVERDHSVPLAECARSNGTS